MTCRKSDISALCGEAGASSDEPAAAVCAPPAVTPPEPIDVYDADRRPTGLVIDRRSQRLGQGQYMLYAERNRFSEWYAAVQEIDIFFADGCDISFFIFHIYIPVLSRYFI